MSARYVLTAQATEDLALIAEVIAQSGGLAPAERVVRELERNFGLLAENPDVGHSRADIIQDPQLRFWVVYEYLIVFVSTARALAIVSILHGARDPRLMAEMIRVARDRT